MSLEKALDFLTSGQALESDQEDIASAIKSNISYFKLAAQTTIYVVPEDVIVTTTYGPNTQTLDLGFGDTEDKFIPGGVFIIGTAKTGPMILINEDIGELNETLLHEIIHAITLGVTSADENTLGEEELKFKRRMRDLFNATISYLEERDRYDEIESIYGLSELDEFIAESLVNEEFRELLSTIPANKNISILGAL